ncbi:outer membrane lipoprotein carrier protein LolA [Planctomycetales bacterium ZRK34]|nr:outer membrane lipoprotein carrier protein LolA [Planctomycetales bacterium ZRK34]
MKQQLWMLMGVVIAAAGCLAPPAVQAEDKAVDTAVTHWLDKLETRGRSLKSFTANVVFDKENTLLGDRQVRMGTVAYSAASGEGSDPARFVIDFNKMVVNDALRDRRTVYVFDGSWLVEKNFDRKMFQKRQVVAPGQSFDPLSLDGPFPLPLGQKRDNVLARFTVSVMEDESDAKFIHLRLVPREDVGPTEGQKEFDQIDLWFNPNPGADQYLPTKIVARQAPDKTTVELRDIVTDKMTHAEMDKRFDTTPPGPGTGWNVDIKPFKP